ncbi:uncharacterized protein LOC110900598 [Helianthus annuus]|uniref:uncharacterized protein LOC110900598 n=1 Tax=Helianthus annuus TaxID=4232 RepID=UPI000B8FEC6D|nr:uncharacterized protein LOC110900598 [Helianthus annuus]
MEDFIYGPSTQSISIREFYECIQTIELVDIPSHGLHYTWNQKPKNGVGILKKIDRVMGNVKFLELCPDAYALFQPYRVSDHTPCILKLPEKGKGMPKPFKFPNFIVAKPEFRQCVAKEWEKGVDGVNMFSVVVKLKNLKPHLRKILFCQGNLHERVILLRKELDSIQKMIDTNPHDILIREAESKCLQEVTAAAYDEECFLKQKSKMEWLCAGDSNTTYFHNSVKYRNARAKISSVKDVHGNQFDGTGVPAALLAHYSNFLGTEDPVTGLDDDDLFVNSLSTETANHMVRNVTREEVKQAMFSIGENKAPGPDGYTSAFFKNAWDIVGDEVTNAILDFFDNGKILKQINHTILALVPKKDTPHSVLDYRPISCCNVLYKCISKIITDRMKGSLEYLVSINQSAFVPGRKISDNILLTQELMHNYHVNRGPPRCAFKIDIQKAYDTVSWAFLKSILSRFGFHQKMITWIMTCVSTASYSISINGNLHGFFNGKRGLRQGDPMSSYLFTLIMEVLSLLFQHAALLNPMFKFHAHCSKQKIINVSFADDLFVFVRGDANSVNCLKNALAKFTSMSGLVPSPSKSTVFFCNVPRNTKDEILELMPFQEGTLPVRYLGVPLISTKLAYKECKTHVERMDRRIDNWMSKALSFAGRIQLINSVLSAMYTYWASVFILPARVIKEIERRMRRFLWNAGNQGTPRSKVAWKTVCLPKDEGGLGIRSISDVNKALMTAHVWSIINNRQSLWVQWIYSHKLKGRSLWDIQSRGNMSWGWRKILAIRTLIRPYFWKSVKSGSHTNAWSDNWCTYSPLRSFITPRSIAGAGFTLQSTVDELVDENGQWRWPQAWYDLYPVLINLSVPQLNNNMEDRLMWKDADGKDGHFSTWKAWNNIRNRENRVFWAPMVWFGQCIPRHSFHLWLVIKDKLKTQDRLSIWEAGSATNLNLMCCPLCRNNRNSRDHLFFKCVFASKVWHEVKKMVDLDTVTDTWSSVLTWIEQHSTTKSLEGIATKLIIAASTYFIWQERNSRLFTQACRSSQDVAQVIISTVRLRLMGLQVSSIPRHKKILDRWQIPWNNMKGDMG